MKIYTIKSSNYDRNHRDAKYFKKKQKFIVTPYDQKQYELMLPNIFKYSNVHYMKVCCKNMINIKVPKSTKIFDLSECNVFKIKIYTNNIQTLYLPFLEFSKSFTTINPTLFCNLTYLYAENSSLEFLPTIPTLKYLNASHSLLTKISNQPKLQELIIRDTNIANLPELMPELEYLVIPETKITILPDYKKIKFIISFNTEIKNIPKSICSTIEYLFVENHTTFTSPPININEYYIKSENAYFIKNKTSNICLENTENNPTILPVLDILNILENSVSNSIVN